MRLQPLILCVIIATAMSAISFHLGKTHAAKQASPASTTSPRVSALPPVSVSPVASLPRPLRLGVIGDSLTIPKAVTRADSWLRILVDTKRVTCGPEAADPNVSGGRSWRHAWVESGATTQMALDRGWVSEAADALRAGELDVVVVMIGIDDLSLFQSDYLKGKPIPESHWDAVCTRIETNWLRMAHALQGHRGIVMFSEMPDPLGVPMIARFLRRDEATRARLQAAVSRLNSYLITLTASRGLPLFDFVRRQRTLAIDPAAQVFSDVTLLPLSSGGEIDRGFASDGTHLGPIPTAVLAGGLVEAFNCYQAGIPPLAAAEVGELARLFVASHATTASTR